MSRRFVWSLRQVGLGKDKRYRNCLNPFLLVVSEVPLPMPVISLMTNPFSCLINTHSCTHFTASLPWPLFAHYRLVPSLLVSHFQVITKTGIERMSQKRIASDLLSTPVYNDHKIDRSITHSRTIFPECQSAIAIRGLLKAPFSLILSDDFVTF